MAPTKKRGMTPADFRHIALSFEGVEELPNIFIPIPGGWGRMGMTHVVLAQVSEDVLRGALQTAWHRRLAANKRTKKK